MVFAMVCLISRDLLVRLLMGNPIYPPQILLFLKVFDPLEDLTQQKLVILLGLKFLQI